MGAKATGTLSVHVCLLREIICGDVMSGNVVVASCLCRLPVFGHIYVAFLAVIPSSTLLDVVLQLLSLVGSTAWIS